MDPDKFNRWLTLGANLGVLVGIIFLAIEISQNTEMMRTQINQSRAEQAMSEAQSMYNSDYVPALLVKVKNGEVLSSEEFERYRHFFRALNRNWDNQYRQYREGFLDDNIPRSIRNGVLLTQAGHGLGHELWEKTKHIYTDEYIEFVDSILTENPDKSIDD
jgi:hypothetical protein